MINILIFSFGAYILSVETALYAILTYLAAAKTVDFVVDGVELISADSPLGISCGTFGCVGFSLGGDSLPAGSGTLATFEFDEIPKVHQMMKDGFSPTGNMAVLVGLSEKGQKNHSLVQSRNMQRVKRF